MLRDTSKKITDLKQICRKINLRKFVKKLKNPTTKRKLPIISTMYDVAKSIPGDIGKAKYLSAGFKALGLAVAPMLLIQLFKMLQRVKI